jgi:hypothetical protein
MSGRLAQLSLFVVALLIGVLLVGQLRSQAPAADIRQLSAQELSTLIEQLLDRNRELRIGLGVVATLGLGVFLLLVLGNAGGLRPELDTVDVSEVLAQADPAARYGDAELHVVGWYAELEGDCLGDDGGANARVAWLQRECPLRVLLSSQPDADVSQSQLERDGLRLAAPQGSAFPSRAQPHGPNLQLQPLVFAGHFDDAAAAECVPERVTRCRTTFVVNDYDGYVR